MPSIKRKLCSNHGIYTTKRCELCSKYSAKQYNKHSRDKESTKVHNSRRWQKVRKLQLESNPLCINFDVCGNVAEIVDHIVEIRDGGDHFNLDNLQSMCRACHNTKTSEEKKKRENVSFRL